MKAVLLSCLLFFGFAFAGSEKEKAEALFNAAILSSANYESAIKAEDAFTQLDKENPSFYNKIRMATLIAVKAKHSSIFKKKGLADDSVKAFETLEPYIQETNKAEDIYEFHFFRGRTYSNFPSFLGKAETAKQDLDMAVRMVRGGLVNNRPTAETARLFASYGKVLINEGKKSEGITFLKEAFESGTLEGEDLEFAQKHLN